jgi:tRNA(Ile2) C34 agmatinyltransferase TiaS
MNAELVSQQPRCVRCGGKMVPDGNDGDRACFTCGNVVYRLPPVEPPTRRERRPSHGGANLN